MNSSVNAVLSAQVIRNTILNSDESNNTLQTLQNVVQTDGPHDVSILKAIHDNFFNPQQQDAEEFMMQFLLHLKNVLPLFPTIYTFKTYSEHKCYKCDRHQNMQSSVQTKLHLPLISTSNNIQDLIYNFYKPQHLDKLCDMC